MVTTTNSHVFEARGESMLAACKHAETAKVLQLRQDILSKQMSLQDELRKLVAAHQPSEEYSAE